MPAKLIFTSPPYADEFVAPDMRFIEILMLYVGSEYWCLGPGQAWFVYESGNLKSKLVLTFDNSAGFFLEYKTSNDDKFFSFGEGDLERSVTVSVGGNPWVLSLKFFVPRNKAWEAVKVFCETGTMCDQIEWTKSSDVNWDYGMG